MKRLMTLGILVAVGGCRSMEDVKFDKDGGTTKIYAGSVEELLVKSEAAFKEHGAKTVERDEAQVAVFAHFEANAVHDGTFCGAWVTAAGPGKVSVRCVSKNRSPHVIGCALTEKAFHELLQAKVSPQASK